MRIPGFTAEESSYRTTRQYRTHVTFNQTDGAIRPALVGETEEPVGFEFCVQRCKPGCIKTKGCNQMAPAKAAQCKLDCESWCQSDCSKVQTPPPSSLSCDFLSGRWISCNLGIPAWLIGCVADGLPGCFEAAKEMKAQSHCEACD
jgi:hypothetical protein